MHNQGHVWIGGTMLSQASPNDPAFFYHHANVDRLYQRWLENSGQVYANEKNGGKPTQPTPADYPAVLTPLTNAACKAKYPEYRSMVKMQSEQRSSLALVPARLAAMGGSVLPGRGRPSGRPVTDSSGARASRHQSRLFPSL